MSTPNPPSEQRRAPRKRVDFSAPVTDTISGRLLGHLGNLSATGLLLIGQRAPRSDAVYQVSVPLPSFDGSAPTIEIGIQEQWQEPAASPGQVWAGYRIVAITQTDSALLDRWLQA